MNKLELQKMAVEVRKGFVTGIIVQNQATGRLLVSSRHFYLSFL